MERTIEEEVTALCTRRLARRTRLTRAARFRTLLRSNGQLANGAPVDRAAVEAARWLARRDPRMAALVRRYGPHRPAGLSDPFGALLASIVQQQVSMASAAAVTRRLRASCPRGKLTPQAILALREEELVAAGLSRQKRAYILGLAEAFASKRLTGMGLRAMSDEEVIAATTQLKGIGQWTAEMLLMFCLDRPDVWPIDDLGLRRAVRRFLHLPADPDRETLLALGERYRPYRTFASWFLWRSLEGGPAGGEDVWGAKKIVKRA